MNAEMIGVGIVSFLVGAFVLDVRLSHATGLLKHEINLLNGRLLRLERKP